LFAGDVLEPARDVDAVAPGLRVLEEGPRGDVHAVAPGLDLLKGAGEKIHALAPRRGVLDVGWKRGRGREASDSPGSVAVEESGSQHPVVNDMPVEPGTRLVGGAEVKKLNDVAGRLGASVEEGDAPDFPKVLEEVLKVSEGQLTGEVMHNDSTLVVIRARLLFIFFLRRKT